MKVLTGLPHGALVLTLALLAPSQSRGESRVLFERTFEEPESHRELQAAGGGERQNESITHVEDGATPGSKSVKLSFIPSSGRYWYYKLPCNIKVDTELLLKIEGNLKFRVQGRFDPLASIRLGLTYNCYADDTYSKVTARSSDGVVELVRKDQDKRNDHDQRGNYWSHQWISAQSC